MIWGSILHRFASSQGSSLSGRMATMHANQKMMKEKIRRFPILHPSFALCIASGSVFVPSLSPVSLSFYLDQSASSNPLKSCKYPLIIDTAALTYRRLSHYDSNKDDPPCAHDTRFSHNSLLSVNIGLCSERDRLVDYSTIPTTISPSRRSFAIPQCVVSPGGDHLGKRLQYDVDTERDFGLCECLWLPVSGIGCLIQRLCRASAGTCRSWSTT